MQVIRFIKNWTLPCSIVMGAVTYFIFAFIPALGPASTFLSPIMARMLPVFMFLTLYVTFCKVNFRELKVKKWHFWVALAQLFLIIALVSSILFFHLTGNNLILLESILTCIIGPCAAAAAVVTQKLGGNLEEMTAYTLLDNLLCAVIIPVCFPLIAPGKDINFLSAFLLICNKVATVLILPMLLALITKHVNQLHSFHHWVTGIHDLGFYLWGCSLLIVTGTTMKNIIHAQTTTFFLINIAIVSLTLCMTQFLLGKLIGYFFNSSINAGQALGQKNTPFAIWIACTYLNPLSSVGPGCYILWQNIINSFEIWQERRKSEKTEIAPGEKVYAVAAQHQKNLKL